MPPADRKPAERDPGFTLIEVTIVLVILGLVAGLVLTRGPPRSAALEMQQAGTLVANTLRLARSRAIATDRPVPVRFAPGGAALQLGDDAPRALPNRIRMVHGAPAITFRPDGSADGGTIELAGDARTMTLEVDWITGRVVAR